MVDTQGRILFPTDHLHEHNFASQYWLGEQQVGRRQEQRQPRSAAEQDLDQAVTPQAPIGRPAGPIRTSAMGPKRVQAAQPPTTQVQFPNNSAALVSSEGGKRNRDRTSAVEALGDTASLADDHTAFGGTPSAGPTNTHQAAYIAGAAPSRRILQPQEPTNFASDQYGNIFNESDLYSGHAELRWDLSGHRAPPRGSGVAFTAGAHLPPPPPHPPQETTNLRPRRLQFPVQADYYSQPQDATSPSPHTDYPTAAFYPTASLGYLHPESQRLQHFAQFAVNQPNRQNLSNMEVEASMVNAGPPMSAHDESTIGELTMSRKRSHSQMSQPSPEMMMENGTHRRSASIASAMGISQGELTQGELTQGDDYAAPRGSRTVKRENPPTNSDGKYFCAWSDKENCYGQLFDRKCEWSKHMDKHDRPYRCLHKMCEKLQGFTYSGGLLRHEREVHGSHGGPKAQLMCPYEGCRRSNGKGFTRKENYNEHLRRVHNNKQPLDSQLTTYPPADAMPGAEEADTPISRMSDGTELNSAAVSTAPSMSKRKRSEVGGGDFGPSDELDRLHAEIRHLHEMLTARNVQIEQLTQDHRIKDEQLRDAQAALQLSQARQ